MQSIDELLDHFRWQRQATRRLIDAIPAHHFSWRPNPAAFSAGEIVRHLMQSEIFFRRLIASGARGDAFDPFQLSGTGEERLKAFRPSNLEGSRNPKFGASFAECLAHWTEIQAKTEEELRSVPSEALSATTEHPLLAYRAPLWTLLLIMIEHEVHHRGQLSAYLKVLDIDQPASIFG